MPEEQFRKQILKIFDKLPADLKQAILSEDTADTIWNISEKYGIKDKVSRLADFTGQVMLGILPPAEYPETLKKELELDGETVKNIVHDINRYIFSSVKKSLSELYAEEGGLARTLPKKPSLPENKLPRKELPKRIFPREEPKEGDVYREPIE